ncbi:unnamed protein product, partial [Prunus brigantina]
MPTEDSHGTQHHTPRGETSRRNPPSDANVQAKLELLRASVTKMSERYDHLHAKNVELEHDYRTLKPTPGEGLGDSENWGQDYLEDYKFYRTEAFEELYPAHGHPHTRPPAPETLPHADPAMRLLFEKDEPLREYAARFSHEYSRCPETDDRAAYSAFKSGLRESNFRYLVHSNPWNTYAELMKHAAVHAKAEYFNSKRGPATPARNPFANPTPAS